MRAWAYGDQRVGTGTAGDTAGVERPVLVVTQKHVPEALSAAPGEDEDVSFDSQAAQFVCRIRIDPHHPLTMGRYFHTHWFMNCPESA